MKQVLLILFFSFSLFGYSQNWKPLNPKWSPQYSTPGTEEIDFCTKIDSVIGTADQTTYYLHPTYTDCADCPLSDENPLGVYLKESPLFGERIVREGNSYSFYGLGLVLKPSTNSGDSYSFTFDGGDEITATVTGSDQTTVLEVIDSTKTFAFSNGMEIILSKNFGIISFTADNGNTEILLGIPELVSGTYYPGIRDFYDFEVGDVFMYLSSYGSDDPYYYYNAARVEITQVVYNPDTLTVTFTRASRQTTTGVSQGNYYTYTDHYFSENQEGKIYLHNNSLQGLIPGMMTFPLDTLYIADSSPFDGQLNSYPGQYGAAYYVDSTEYNGRKALSIGGLEPAFDDTTAIGAGGGVSCEPCGALWNSEGDEWKNSIPLDADLYSDLPNYNFLLNDSLKKFDYFLSGACSGYTTYAEGLGLIANMSGCSLQGSSIFMIGYRKGEEEYGTIYPLETILSDVRELSKIDVKIFPNPADNFFILDIPESYIHPFSISLTDLSGREVFRKSGLKGKSRIKTGNLASGVYILCGENENYTFSQKVVVE